MSAMTAPHPVRTTTEPKSSEFTGQTHWIQLDAGTEDLEHLISPEERLRVAMARQ